jgi:hypothetical protein
MDFLKMLADMVNCVFQGTSYPDFSINSKKMRSSFSVPRLASLIESVKFYRSVAVIQKANTHPPAVYHI